MKEIYYTDMELKQLNIIQSVIDKKRTGKEAANALHISERQIWRKVKSVKEQGEIGIKHKNQFREFISFKQRKSYKPLKNGYFFVKI